MRCVEECIGVRNAGRAPLLPVQLIMATQAAAKTSAFFMPAVYRGRMFTFVWKKFSGSYFVLRSRSRS